MEFFIGFWGLCGVPDSWGLGPFMGSTVRPMSCLWAFGLSCGLLFLSHVPPVFPASVKAQSSWLLPRPPDAPTPKLVANYVSFTFKGTQNLLLLPLLYLHLVQLHYPSLARAPIPSHSLHSSFQKAPIKN